MGSVWKRIGTRLFILYQQCVWTFLVGANLTWRRITGGAAVFEVKQRSLPRRLKEEFTHRFITLPNGMKIHYVEAGDEKAPLMLCVHGFPEFWYSWRYQIAHFSERYRVVAIDQRGYGDSDKPKQVTEYHIDKLAEDIDLLIHALGYTDATTVGHDWGGAVVWRHALHYPHSVNTLIVLNCPHPAAFSTLLANNSRQRSSSWYIFFFQSSTLPELAYLANDFQMLETIFWGKKAGLRNKENFTEEDMEAWKYTFSTPDALTPPLDYYRCSVQYPVGGNVFQKCKPRTLIIWGEDDVFLAREAGQLSADWCESGKVEYVSGASHWVQQDAPHTVNHLIDDFLRQSNTKPHAPLTSHI